MNITKAQAKTALGFQFDTELADFLGFTKQAVSRLADEDPLPDGWCWRGARKRPDVFSPPPANEAGEGVRDAA